MKYKMDTKQVLIGTIVWTVGLLVPLAYHATLVLGGKLLVGDFGRNWIVWFYLVAMAIVGGCLVVSGFMRHDGRHE